MRSWLGTGLRSVRAVGLTGLLCLGLAACASDEDRSAGRSQPPGADQTALIPPDDPKAAEIQALNKDRSGLAGAEGVAADAPILIGLLLPMTGAERALGQMMLNGAQMAVLDHAAPRFELRPYNTRGTAAGAADAAGKAVEDGVRLILGPLFSSSVAAVAPIARRGGINVIAFTNDRAAAGDHVYILGHHLQPQIQTVIAYAQTKGIRRVAALVPADRFGSQATEAIVAATRASGVELHRVVTYDEDVNSIDSAVRQLAEYDSRKAALDTLRARLGKRKDANALAQIDRLKRRDTIGEVDFDAIVVPSGSNLVHSIAARLPYYDISSKKVRVLGISTWERLDLKREPALEGAWYATPASDIRSDFERRFKKYYAVKPEPLASLAYDAAAIAALLSRRVGGPDFSAKALADERGFEGASGLFRFRADGLSERTYAISEIGHDNIKQVNGASRSFGGVDALAGKSDPPKIN